METENKLPDSYDLLEENDIKVLNIDEKLIWGSLNDKGRVKILTKAQKRYQRELKYKKWSKEKEEACALYVHLLAKAAGKKGDEKQEITEKLNEARLNWMELKKNKPVYT